MLLIDFHTHRETAEGVITPRSFGIHPWKAGRCPQDYQEFLNAYSEQCLDAEIIGECGLDKACNVDWRLQTAIFRWQVEIAAENHKPMVIHCVRAANEVMEMRCKVSSLHSGLPPWVIHGFIGNPQQAEQLFRAGIWVSFGAAILDYRREKVRNCLSTINTPFFLETDDADCGIAEIYEAAAEIRKCSLEKLSDTIKDNYTSLFVNSE